MKITLVIPNYNHKEAIAKTLDNLAELNLHCYLIDDGSNDETRYLLQELANQHSWITLIHHPYNRGKGAAVMTGLRAAFRDGYTHALQVDADGQHNLTDIPAMIDKASAHPDALISGQPIYDDSVPKGRLYGRYITHFWVWVETLSFDIKDSMCGFRVYPLSATEQLFQQTQLGERMDFDIEVLVRLYWQGVDIIHLPTQVIYPEDGISHFQGLKDNLRISKLHTRLFFGMLARLPKLLTRNKSTLHWSNMRERGSYIGIRLLAECYRWGGHWLCRAFMYPVILYFFLTGSTTRQASMKFLHKVRQLEPNNSQLTAHSWHDSFRHFLFFGNAALDRIDAWCNKLKLDEVRFPKKDKLTSLLESGQGAVMLASHLGNIELCRAISTQYTQIKVNVLVLTQNAENFNRVLKQLNPSSSLNLIQVSELGPASSMLLKQKVEDGELVVIAADRTSSNAEGRVFYAPFLGEEAAFPQGPFILASLMDCPTFLMFCLKEKTGYQVHLEEFTQSITGSRKGRMERLQKAVTIYAQRLEHYARRAPLQWFNFYDFWHNDNEIVRHPNMSSK